MVEENIIILLPVPGPPASSQQLRQPVVTSGLHLARLCLSLLSPLRLRELSWSVGFLGHHQAGQQQDGGDDGDGVHNGVGGLMVSDDLVT